MLRIALFGAVSITRDDAPDDVRGAIPQAILARLALARGAPVATDDLVADLWADPPSSVVSSLRAHVSRLRARGWGDVLAGGAAGYRLTLHDDAVDIVRWEALIGGGTGRPRIDELRDAGRLWSAPPLKGLRAFPFAPPVVARLEGLRRDATLEEAALLLAEGANADAVSALAPLVAAHPDDPAVVTAAATALSRAGRTADAVGVIDRHLVGEDAADRRPADEIVLVRQAIVRHDPAIAEPSRGAGGARGVERHGVPLPLTRFVGRERELEAVARGRAESRLVTLTGAAGVGKTRLAVEVARRAGPDEDEVQRLIDLTAVSSPAHVVATVADSVAATEHDVDAIARTIAGRRVLLVLDNAEHVLGAVAALCAALLERCDGLGVLVTSREAMRMAGERVVAVEPLLGDATDDAVTLFLHRATDSSGVTVWSDAHLQRIRELCTALDGLPLAIELAAARLDVLSVDELAESLRRSGAPAAGERGRHDSIDDAIAWSTRLTSDAERGMLGQLALFSGSFTLEAVAGVCESPSGDVDPRELAVALARRSLVSVTTADSGERRFRVLESVRHHARTAFPVPDTAAWRRRHAAWMTGLAERLEPLLRTRDVRRVKAAFGTWRADFDDALTFLVEASDRDGAVRLAAALAWYWYERGLGADAVATIDRALALAGDPLPDAEARALHAAAFLRAVGTEPLETVRATRRFAEAADTAENPALPALAHVMLAYLAAGAGDEQQAEAELEVAASHRERITDAYAWARADEGMIRGDALRLLGRPAQALDVLAEAYRAADEIGHTWAVKGACFVTGKVLTSVGRPADAVRILRTGAIRSLESDDPTSAFAAINAAAAAYVRLDDATRAVEIFAAVDAVGDRFGYHPEGSDGAYTENAREAARRALTPAEWDAAYARGSAMDLRAVMGVLAAFR